MSLQVHFFENLTLNFEFLSSYLDLDYGLDTGPLPGPLPGHWTGPGAWQHRITHVFKITIKFCWVQKNRRRQLTKPLSELITLNRICLLFMTYLTSDGSFCFKTDI